MALTQVYSANAGDTITSARWNNEFGNLYNNGTDVAFPLTKAVSFAGWTITLDASGNTTIISSASQGLQYTPGTKTGTPSTTGGVLNVVASTYTDNNTAGAGTAAAWAGIAIQRPTLTASNANVTTTDAATLYIANSPAEGTNDTITNEWALWVDAGACRFDGILDCNSDVDISGNLRGTVAMGYYIQGLTYSNNSGDATNDLDIAIGMATSDDAAQANRRTMTLATALTKRSDATFVVGTNQGMLDTGAVGNSDYYLWLIMRSDTGVVDVLSSLSSTAPNMPASYDYKRLIGWFKRVGGTIVAFKTYEREGGALEMNWDVPTLDVNLANTLTTSRRTDAVKVPLNFSTIAHINASVQDSAATVYTWICCPDQTDAAPSVTAAPIGNLTPISATVFTMNQLSIRTSAAGLIAARCLTDTADLYIVSTMGFTWARRN